ncbi:cytochrome C [Oceaniovalibus sp. ACAM 378]|uniref:cytochrome C n=1 Tax=Oceaniovalibus sp. ACAM 378 TaxID=2599923 RepID=UPI0011D5032D|nr:cytochrome C [Oceaniovalibus sp. ACAM 378]TYB86737.1 cytochrome C [Oceaniovalibus sp. ACAM 378]
MNKFLTIAAATILATGPALAESELAGDVAAGEKAFGQCASCHVVQNEEGETLAGRNAKTGPNLYGIAGMKAGELEGFRFGKSIIEAGEKGLVWNEEKFVAYVQDPAAFLKAELDDSKARSKMAFKVRKEEDAINLYAFLASLAPPVEN